MISGDVVVNVADFVFAMAKVRKDFIQPASTDVRFADAVMSGGAVDSDLAVRLVAARRHPEL